MYNISAKRTTGIAIVLNMLKYNYRYIYTKKILVKYHICNPTFFTDVLMLMC